MSDANSSGFSQIAATLVGALITLLVSTRAQEQRKEPPPSSTSVSPSGAMAVALVNPDGSPVSEEKPLPVENKP